MSRHISVVCFFFLVWTSFKCIERPSMPATGEVESPCATHTKSSLRNHEHNGTISDSAVDVSDYWMQQMSRWVDFKPSFCELYDNYSVQALDSIMTTFASEYYDAHGGKDRITDVCKPIPLNGYNPDIRHLCHILNGELLMTVIGYGVVLCTNLTPIFDWYQTYKQNIGADEYRWLELTDALIARANSIQNIDLDLNLMDTSLKNKRSAVKMKAHEIRHAIHKSIETGTPVNLDSVLMKDFTGLSEILQGEF